MVEGVVRRGVINAAVLFAVAMSTAEFSPVRAQQTSSAAIPNGTPLAFGMDAQQASLALGTTLNYVSGRPGDEIYLALSNVKGGALSDRSDGLYLQFRRGRLQGWKGDWNAVRPCCNR
jgi:hypothetical protein